MQGDTTYFRLFAQCIPVKGAKRSALCDLIQGRKKYIPNLLFEILQLSNTKTVNEIKAFFGGEEDEGIDAYFDLLINEEWAFLTTHPEWFPKLSMHWESSTALQSCILEYSNTSSFSIYETLNQLNDLGCAHIEIRNFDAVNLKWIEKLLDHVKGSRIQNIFFILKYNEELKQEGVETLLGWDKSNTRMRSLILHSAPFNKSVPHASRSFDKIIRYTKTKLTPESEDMDHPDFFCGNIPSFTEAQRHNLGLNRKVCIDTLGFVKNHISHKNHFGNINETLLEHIIKKPDFQSQWNINKDKVEVCKDCEHRYVCADNTEIEEKKGVFHRVKKCKYNPYAGKWEE